MDEKELEIFNLKVRIIERAESMNITKGLRSTRVLDLDHACDQFDMRLADWLAADDEHFAHDWIGIQSNINRQTGRIENHFVPRFSANGKPTKADHMRFIAQSVTAMVNRLIDRPIEITYRKETKESLKDYTEWAVQRFRLYPGGEFFYVWRGELLYAVDVTADSYLTGADELMRLLARKF